MCLRPEIISAVLEWKVHFMQQCLKLRRNQHCLVPDCFKTDTVLWIDIEIVRRNNEIEWSLKEKLIATYILHLHWQFSAIRYRTLNFPSKFRIISNGIIPKQDISILTGHNVDHIVMTVCLLLLKCGLNCHCLKRCNIPYITSLTPCIADNTTRFVSVSNLQLPLFPGPWVWQRIRNK